MATTLNFTQDTTIQDGCQYVSSAISDVDQFTAQLVFDIEESLTASIIVEASIDDTTWCSIARERARANYMLPVADIPTGVSVRIRSSIEPSTAKYI